jgi:hypothetical protein
VPGAADRLHRLLHNLSVVHRGGEVVVGTCRLEIYVEFDVDKERLGLHVLVRQDAVRSIKAHVSYHDVITAITTRRSIGSIGI